MDKDISEKFIKELDQLCLKHGMYIEGNSEDCCLIVWEQRDLLGGYKYSGCSMGFYWSDDKYYAG